MTRHYMACVDLQGRSVLVVGGGRIALEKTRGLVECGARVTVVAPEVDAQLDELPVRVVRRPFVPGDVDGHVLVFAATNRRSVNRNVSSAAAASYTLCNVADDPELCSFILPAVTRRDPIVVGVSTGGASPALAQRIRDDIADLLTPRHAELARRLQALRPWAKRSLGTYEQRRAYFAGLVEEALQ
jgi:siroheme synthase-like protein